MTKSSSLAQRIKKYIPRTEVQYLYFLSAVVLAASFVLLLWFAAPMLAWPGRGEQSGTSQFAPPPTSLEAAEPPCVAKRVLDGVCVSSEEGANSRAVGIMVENAYDAWPLSGLSAASVVYEAPVEGGIPRFLALYPIDSEVDKAGPVRSARPYFIDWMSEYGKTLYMHVGGSPDALEKLEQAPLIDVNEFYHGLYFWRDESRGAPHNAYTASGLWQKAWKRYGKDTEAGFTGWTFSTSTPCAEDCTPKFTVSFFSPMYDATWEYDAASGVYNRFQNTRRDRDDNDAPIVANTVIVQRVKASVVDEIGRLELASVGKGEALIFRDGRLIRGQWKKASSLARTVWLDENGDPIPLAPGKIWIEVLPMNGKVIFSSSTE